MFLRHISALVDLIAIMHCYIRPTGVLASGLAPPFFYIRKRLLLHGSSKGDDSADFDWLCAMVLAVETVIKSRQVREVVQ